MSSNESPCFDLSRLYRSRHRNRKLIRLIGRARRLSDKFLFAAILIGLAVSVHVWCCDWRLPKRKPVGGGKYEIVYSDSQLMSYIHAGKPFRTPSKDGFWYNLDKAGFCGIILPLFIAFPGVMALLSLLAPENSRGVVQRCQLRLLGYFKNGRVFLLRCQAKLLGYHKEDVCKPLLLMVILLTGCIFCYGGTICLDEFGRAVYVPWIEDPLAQEGVGSANNALAGIKYRTHYIDPYPKGRNDSQSSTGSVPEPSTLVLLAIGTLAFLAYAWRRRRER